MSDPSRPGVVRAYALPDADDWALVVDYDSALWLALEETDDTDTHVVELARERLAEAGWPADAETVTRLSTMLLAATRLAFDPYRDDEDLEPLAFVYNPIDESPMEFGPLLLVFQLPEALAGDDEVLSLASADDPDVIEPPDVSWVETRLGTGVRCKRFSRQLSKQGGERGSYGDPVFLALTYAWNLRPLDVAVRLVCADTDVGELASLLDEVDEFARGMYFEPDVASASDH